LRTKATEFSFLVLEKFKSAAFGVMAVLVHSGQQVGVLTVGFVPQMSAHPWAVLLHEM
jgi:hypothetical protein